MAESKPRLDTPEGSEQASASSPWALGEPFAHALLFTGHMIDRPERAHPRFPEWAEARVREALCAAVRDIRWSRPGATIGLAGAASGGDLLFHEVCEELKIPTRILLALPPEQFLEASVAPAGQQWIERFHALLARRGSGGLWIMPEERGDAEAAEKDLWERANAWMIEQAIEAAAERALLALWDGAAGDGPGGTGHFIEVAKGNGLRVVAIDMGAILRS